MRAAKDRAERPIKEWLAHIVISASDSAKQFKDNEAFHQLFRIMVDSAEESLQEIMRIEQELSAARYQLQMSTQSMRPQASVYVQPNIPVDVLRKLINA